MEENIKNNKKDVNWYRKRVKILQDKPQPEQRTPEWFKQRQTRITASEAASCLFKNKKTCEAYVKQFGLDNFRYRDTESINPYESRDEYIIKKCRAYYGESVFKDNPFTIWGKKYENIATRLYCKHNSTEVYEFGLLSHSRLKWLAASPDGITPDGIMLEIKCPKSRKIDITAPTLYYFCQMQLQLEVADLDQCDFLECEIVELTEEEWLDYKLKTENTDYPQQAGILIQLKTEPNQEFAYIYPPIELETKEDYSVWKDKMLSENDGSIALYWIIKNWNIMHIKRDKQWFENVKEDIKSTWKIITRLQSSEQEFLKYKDAIFMIKNKDFIERWTKTDCIIADDTSSTFVLNKSSTNSVNWDGDETTTDTQTNNENEKNESDKQLNENTNICNLNSDFKQILLGPSQKKLKNEKTDNCQSLLSFYTNYKKENIEEKNYDEQNNEEKNCKEEIECLID